MGAGTDSEVMLRRALQAADCVDVEIVVFFYSTQESWRSFQTMCQRGRRWLVVQPLPLS